MTTIRQLIQNSPARANELFAQLLDTSDTALKTREKLTAELTQELNEIAELEEKHLFPVLRKHKQTKDLVAEALSENKQMRKLLSELDKTPRDSEDFADRVTELRRVFQLHVRDGKKELLPAVLEALSDEETQAIVESIEDRKAEIEEEKRSEADERRAAARQEREQEEGVKQAAETVVSALWSGPQAAQRTAQRAQDAARTGVSTLTDVAQRTSDQVFHVFDQTGERAQEFAQQSSANLTLMAEAGSIMVRGLQDFSQESLRVMQGRLQQNLNAFAALTRCRSLSDLMAVQNELMRDRLQVTSEGARRLAAIATKVADEATQATSSSEAKQTQRRAA